MGRSLMLLLQSRNHHHLFKRTFHNNNLRFNERQRQSFLVQRHCFESDAFYFSLVSTENWAPLREIRLPFFERWRCISGSCGGILHFHDHLGIGLLWKPSTNEFKQIPACSSTNEFKHDLSSSSKVSLRRYEHYGLGFDSQTQDYKVVKVSRDSQSQSRIELYSLQNDLWKEISEGVGDEWDRVSCTKAYVNGRYYWYPDGAKHEDEKIIISFDFTSEKFSHVSLPPKITHSEVLGKFRDLIVKNKYYFKLVEFDGKLGMIKYSGNSYELFVLENDGSWTSQFQIQVEMKQIHEIGKDEMKILLLSSDGRFLFLQDFDDEDIPHEVMVYDLRIQELKKLSMYDQFAKVFPYLATSPHQ